jgi:hypothetical protein
MGWKPKPPPASNPTPVQVDTRVKGCGRTVFVEGRVLTTGQCAAPGGHDGGHVPVTRQ